MHLPTALALAATVLTASAKSSSNKGFTTSSFFNNGVAKQYNDFVWEMRAAKSLPDTKKSWSSIRLYTMLQGTTRDEVILAIPAAIETDTKLLLGIWTTNEPDFVRDEIKMLKKAIKDFGKDFTDLVTGIAVGADDLYRRSVGGNGSSPDDIVGYIKEVRAAVKGTSLEGVKIGHVDAWDALADDANSAVVKASDFLGANAYPYIDGVAIDKANASLWDAYNAVVKKSDGTPVWITETGWPAVGDKVGDAEASDVNARAYWVDAVCGFLAEGVDFWHYQLQTAQNGDPRPDWGVLPSHNVLQQKPRYEVTCPGHDDVY